MGYFACVFCGKPAEVWGQCCGEVGHTEDIEDEQDPEEAKEARKLARADDEAARLDRLP